MTDLHLYLYKTKLGNLPDNVATINYQIQSVAGSEETEYRIFTMYVIHT